MAERNRNPKVLEPPTVPTVQSLNSLRLRLGSFALLVFVFSGLGVLASGVGVFDSDVRIARWLQTAPIPGSIQIARFGSWIGSFSILGPLALLVLSILAWQRWRWDAIFLAIAGALHSTNGILKWLVNSPRPTVDLVDITAQANGLGFPSGHATGSTLIFGALAVIATRRIRHRWLRWGAVALCVSLIVIVGFARVKQGVHWPSDVLGGYLWGTAMVILADIVTRRMKMRSTRARAGDPVQ